MAYGEKVVELCSSCRSIKRIGQNCTICGCPVADPIIDLNAYFMGRDVLFKSELSSDLKRNAVALLTKVNKLIQICPTNVGHIWQCTSGWRPESVNREIGGAAGSKHITCQAIDLHDPEFWLQRLLSENRRDLLEACGLYMEDPRYCVYEDVNGKRGGWVHLQAVPPASGNRVFIPYAGAPKIRKS